jgi:hypothetical protein
MEGQVQGAKFFRKKLALSRLASTRQTYSEINPSLNQGLIQQTSNKDYRNLLSRNLILLKFSCNTSPKATI